MGLPSRTEKRPGVVEKGSMYVKMAVPIVMTAIGLPTYGGVDGSPMECPELKVRKDISPILSHFGGPILSTLQESDVHTTVNILHKIG